MSATTLDHRRKFGALRNRHADTVDGDVSDLVQSVARAQSPIDPDGWSTRWANDPTRHKGTFGIRSAAGHPESLAAILRKTLTVNADDIILEKPKEFLPFGLARNTPVRAEHKPGYARNVKILLQQVVKKRLLLSGSHVG